MKIYLFFFSNFLLSSSFNFIFFSFSPFSFSIQGTLLLWTVQYIFFKMLTCTLGTHVSIKINRNSVNLFFKKLKIDLSQLILVISGIFDMWQRYILALPNYLINSKLQYRFLNMTIVTHVLKYTKELTPRVLSSDKSAGIEFERC